MKTIRKGAEMKNEKVTMELHNKAMEIRNSGVALTRNQKTACDLIMMGYTQNMKINVSDIAMINNYKVK